MNKTQNIAPELKPIALQLQAEGYTLYTYTCESKENKNEINSFWWFENGRVLQIQPNSWYNQRYNRDCFNLSVSYIPSHQNGSSCGLSNDNNEGVTADKLLSFRKYPTWVKGSVNYTSIEDYLRKQTVLTWYEIEKIGE